MPHRPLIGITAPTDAAAEPCAAAVERGGGVPRLIAPDHREPAQDTLRSMGGLLVAGADDGSGGRAPRQDTELVRAALDRDMPVLGLGDGMQALNVAMGGAVADLDGHAPPAGEGDEASAYHRIFITPGSKLAAVIGSGGIVRVNSRHWRGVKEAHKSRLLMASAYSLEDGVIEGLERPGHGWVIAVQFHPERRSELPPHFDKLFRALVERADRGQGQTTSGPGTHDPSTSSG